MTARTPFMRRLPVHRDGPFLYFTCACGQQQAVNSAMPWCSGCCTEYDIRLDGVILRPGRKTPRFAVAKAVNLAGGTRLEAGLEAK